MIFILHGKDSFRKQIKIDSLKKKYIQEGMESLSFLLLENPELIHFISTVKTPSFGLGSKIILVREFEFLENKAEDKQVEQLMETLANLPESIIIIFDSSKISGTIKLVKKIKSELEKIVSFEEFTPFTAWDLKGPASWLCKNFDDLEMPLAEHFVEQVGSEDSATLFSEMQRLIIKGEKITRELIDKEVCQKTDIFKFTRLISEAKIEEANKELNKIILAKEAHLGLLAMMDTSISRYLKLKLAQVERKSKEEKIQILGISPNRLYYQEQEVSRMQTEYLEKLLNKTFEAERNVKRGKMPIEKALQFLVNS